MSNFFGLILVFSLCISRGGLFRSASPVGFRRHDQNTHTHTHTHTHSETHHSIQTLIQTHITHTLRDTPIAHRHSYMHIHTPRTDIHHRHKHTHRYTYHPDTTQTDRHTA